MDDIPSLGSLLGDELGFDLAGECEVGGLHDYFTTENAKACEDIVPGSLAENYKSAQFNLKFGWLTDSTMFGLTKEEGEELKVVDASNELNPNTTASPLANFTDEWTSLSPSDCLERLLGRQTKNSQRFIKGSNGPETSTSLPSGHDMPKYQLSTSDVNVARQNSRNGKRRKIKCVPLGFAKRKVEVDGSSKSDGFLVSDTLNSSATSRRKRIKADHNAMDGNELADFLSEIDRQSTSSPEALVPSASPGIVTDTNTYIKDEELIGIRTKELNARVKHLPAETIKHIKHRRRTLKNRKYARSCREKKVSETSSLQRNNNDLEKNLASLKLELYRTQMERDHIKKKYKELVEMLSKRFNLLYENNSEG